MDAVDYGGVAGLAVAVQGLTEVIRALIARMTKDKGAEAEAARGAEIARIKLETVRSADRITALVAQLDKLDSRMEARDEQVRQGIAEANRALSELGLQLARLGA